MASAADEIKSFWDAVAKGIEQARDPVAAAVKAIADGEKDKDKIVREGVRAAIKATQDAEKEKERAIRDAAKKQAKLIEDETKKQAKIVEDALKAEQKALDDALKDQDKAKRDAADRAKKQAEDEAKKRAELNSKYVEGLTTGLSKVSSVLTSAMNALTGFGNKIASFVAKFSPAAAERWTIATDNLQATIGRMLLPVLEKATVLVQRLGNALASLSPQAQGFIAGLTGGAGLGAVLAAGAVAVRALLASLGPIPILIGLVGGAIAGVVGNMASAKSLGDAFSKVLGALGTVIEAIAGVAVPLLTAAIELVTPLIEEFASALEFVAGVIRDALAALGLTEAANYDPNAKNATQAVRRSQVSDLSSFASRNYTAAYSGATSDVPTQQLGVLKDIDKKLGLMNEARLNATRRPEDRTYKGSSEKYRALNPFEKGTDGKTNFDRGVEVIWSRLTSLFG